MTDKHTFWRAFPSHIERTGPRQLTGRLVPYNEATDVGDPLPDGGFDIYREGFRPGSFGPQANVRERGVLSKISLVHRHEGGLGYLGPFVALREEPDGLYGDVAVLRSKADDVEDLLTAGVGELSVEFRLPKANHTEVDVNGVRWRTRAHLDQVALEPRGAYGSARVLAFRAELDEQQAEEAEKQAAEEAEKAKEKEAADAEEAERARVEAEAEAREERRQRWDALAGRLDSELERQAEYLRVYGLTKPGGWKRR